jgi:hypothetical protein
VEVFGHNLTSAMSELEYLVNKQGNHFLALDTEFPGQVVADEELDSQAPYERVRANVERTQLVQLGISVYNSDG